MATESRYHALKENSDAMREIIESGAKRENARMAQLISESNRRAEDIISYKEHVEFIRNRKANYKHEALTECLGTCLKGIYISALQKSCKNLKPANYALAEALVETFIEDEGGAEALLRRMNGKSYLLTTIKEIVEGEVEDVQNTATDDEVDVNEVPQDNKDNALEKLDQEEETDNAVSIISDRIAKAEEEFLKKNAEDKEKIQKIVDDINERIAAVKADNTIDDEQKDKLEEQFNITSRREITGVYENRAHSVFDYLVHEITTCVVKDNELKEKYTCEDGKLDMEYVVNNAKVVYGWLECVGAIKLKVVDEAYIKNILENM